MVPTARDWPKIAALAVAYFVAARLGLELSVAYSNATPVWAPTGISLAALLLFGYRLWPGVALGAFLANAVTDVPLWTSFLITLGNTAEALLGAYLMRRFGRFDQRLERVSDVFALVLFGAAISTAISATVGTTSLLLAGEIPGSNYGFAWQLWWFGDAMGDLLVAPFVLTWGLPRRASDPERRRGGEALVLLVLLVVSGWLVFLGGRWRYPYLLFPLFVWAGLRFRQRGAATVTLVLSTFAVWGTLNGSVPVGGVSLTASVQVLQTVMGILAVTTLILAANITERERDQRALASSLSLLNATLDSTRDGILAVDPDGKIAGYNERFVEMWGIPREIVQSGDDAALRFARDQLEDPEGFLSKIHDVRSEDTLESHDVLRFKDGRIFDRYSRPQRLGAQTVGRVWSFSDVTEQRRLEAARSRFISDAAHELRQPIATLGGVASLLGEDLTKSGDSRLVQTGQLLERQSRRISGLIDRMLNLGRIEARTEIPLRPIDVAAVVDSAVRSVPPPDGKAVSIECEAGLTALGDEGALEQIVANLLTNAYRHGGGSITIECGLDGGIYVSVADDGAGVSPSIIPKLFDPFVRGTHERREGYGLGLAIVQTLARSMNGHISYRPGDPRGAIFTLTLRKPNDE